MLVTTRELIDNAVEKHIGVGAFNVTTLSMLQGIILAAEDVNQGIIIEFATSHETRGIVTLDEIGPVMMQYAERAKVPVAVHLDHGVDLDYLKKAIDIGFTSIMYDGSALPYEENIANTLKAVEMGRKYNVMVEGELGKMAGNTLRNDMIMEERLVKRENYTNPDQAGDFVARTGLDMLACSFGNAHGIYKEPPVLDIELLHEIAEKTSIPLVMHGSSGINEEDYAKVIRNGVRKINYYTYASLAASNAVKGAFASDPVKFWKVHELAVLMREAVREKVRSAITLFSEPQI
ncbi:MAG: class II fructose-bisphosphate aldolase [Erysipelotrichaceae bacterium]|nr:class II fructose-bisphosphate aldolase [Erysipelotrichaceae bacterium]